MEIAIFAAGCFWGVEFKFQRLRGVIKTRVGYVGGRTTSPSYKSVCNGDTGHAEAVEVCFDKNIVSYDELLDAFWAMHDPTQINRQGPDCGTQYRTAIFTCNDDQKASALASREREEKSGRRHGSIATEITEAPSFYPAEEYHQSYIKKKQGLL